MKMKTILFMLIVVVLAVVTSMSALSFDPVPIGTALGTGWTEMPGDFTPVRSYLPTGTGPACTTTACRFANAVTTNNAPVFTSQPATSGMVGQNYLSPVSASDAENDTMTITAPLLPSWLTLSLNSNGAATLSGTPTAAGEYNVTLQVKDAYHQPTSKQFTIVIAPASGSGTGTGTTPTNTSANQDRYNQLNNNYEGFVDDYRDFKRKYQEAVDDADNRNKLKYEDKLNDLDKDLEDLQDDISNFIDDLRRDGTTDAERTYVNQLQELDDDVESLRGKIDGLLHPTQASQSYGNSYTPSQTTPASASTTPDVKVETLPLASGFVPSATTPQAENSFENVRLFVWAAAGLVILLALLLFVVAVALRK